MDDEEQEKVRAETLKETRFWGREDAGSIVMAKLTDRILIGLRSDQVD